MILSFMGEFQPFIEAGSKIFTLRDDPKRRWRTGMDAHMYSPAGPRNGGKQFRLIEGTHIWVCDWHAQKMSDGSVWMGLETDREFIKIKPEVIEDFAWADGFDSFEKFCAYHLPAKFDRTIRKSLITWDEPGLSKILL